MGHCDYDHGGLRRHGTQNVPWHVRGSPLCPGWCTNHRTSRSGHSVQLLHVLLTYSGKKQKELISGGGLLVYLALSHVCFGFIIKINVAALESQVRQLIL